MNIYDFFILDAGLRAFVAAILVGGVCGVLGCFIVLRNMSLIGDALSHAVLPGIVVAFVFFGYSTSAFFAGSVISGLLCALLITWLQDKVKVKNDAAIGIVFTMMFSLGVIGISALSHRQGVHLDLKDFLFGNILAVSPQDLVASLIMAIAVLMVIAIYYRTLFVVSFQSTIARTLGIHPKKIHYLLMLLLAITVVASLRSVGVILVVAMLVTPASAALLLATQLLRVILLSAIIGILSSISGLIIAIQFNFPPGPSMAVVTTLFYLMIVVAAPGKGLFSRWWIRRQVENRVIIEDIVKNLYKLEFDHVSPETIQSLTGHSKNKLDKWLNVLQKRKLVIWENNEIKLTDEGKIRANQLIRAHRLWETFLVDELGLDEDQIHSEAEVYEHYLPDEILQEVDKKLGYPSRDPHGSTIPKERT
ncbi:MAG TPA: iron chelate uptake ABC transporter family permease subunit [Saprospiraceae bacterium]|nr:iron chelate uptake ABC transporter family permease subunit [Saprospiraceae bacterium]